MQKTAYDMRISDWSSDVCSSDLAIRHRARPDDRSRAQIARLRRMGDVLAEVEGHVDARIGPAERLAVEIDAQRPVQLTVPPAIAEHLGGDEHRRHRARRFRLEDRKRTRLNSSQ